MKKNSESTCFPINLLRIRKQKNISGNKLAQLVGINQTTYSSWERGRTEPPLSMLIKLAQTLGCSSDELLGIENNTEMNISQHNIQADIVQGISYGEVKHFKGMNDLKDCENCQTVKTLKEIIASCMKNKR